MRYSALIILSFLISTLSFAQQSINTIEGYAQNQAGGKVEVYRIVDFLSMVESKIASTTIKSDSTFSLSFFNEETQKVKVKINSNYFYMYLQPNGEYDLYVRDKSPYNPPKPEGNQVEYFFGGLDSSDVNAKIIDFEESILNFLKKNFRRADVRKRDFIDKLDTFNLAVEELYAQDSSSYFKVYRRYALASLDDLSFIGSSNRLQKYEYYVKPYTVFYNNDRYMEYFINVCENFHFKRPRAREQQFDKALIKSSPTLIMQSLSNTYMLKNNLRVRELVMIKMLSDVFYSEDYPQTNIIEVLDSISDNAIFTENKEIAKNISFRLTELKPGSKTPDFVFNVDGKKKSKSDYYGTYHYIQFVKSDLKKSTQEIELISRLYNKYGGTTHITTVVVGDDKFDVEKFKKKNKITWDITVIDGDDDILSKFNIEAFPQYVLLDRSGYVVAAPALGPKPNGEYETIERQLYSISKLKP